ncbi:hypothetical protein K470DRAFT_260653 [Piedraia hortae CBS 480.64]|uniref:C3H1-type domain-containing protein n=1 Tax=Piedraia hortae CBS 480.64 TaxID=1314780 RepID=A0A6A7BSY2_9PEZI|nr:hypothetical protein K470DRAFT_260653 [Piedraia hortae CBS 480.64]
MAQIAVLANRINVHKQQQQQVPLRGNFSQHGASRWRPYARRGRGGTLRVHKNRTLVLNGPAVAANPPAAGNLVMRNNAITMRSTFAGEQRAKAEKQTERETAEDGHVQASGRKLGDKTRPQCENFTKHGTCPFGPRCRYAHDPNKVAICKDFLKTGKCPRGEHCDLSHEMTYHRVPACTFFLRAMCTNEACRYPHVAVSPAAPVCRDFATTGYCARGADCDQRHVHECPDFANTGQCARNKAGRCPLPHPEHASVLRKAGKSESPPQSPDAGLSQQQDFVRLG